jgi:hypothetical protein
VLGLERRSVGLVGDQRVLGLDRLERDVRGEALLCVGSTYRAPGFGRTSSASSRKWTPRKLVSKRLQRVTQWMSIVISVAGSACSSPGQRDRVLDLAEHPEVPGRELGLRDAAGVEDGPLLGQILARWQARRVVAGVGDLLFRSRPEPDSYTNDGGC